MKRILVFLAGLAVLAAGCHRVPEQRCQAVPDVEWDALFTRTEGWTGGDVAGSVELGDGRTLWVFGDSWIGGVAEGKHAPGSWMVNNSIAVHDSSKLGRSRAPLYRDLHFFWGPANPEGKPTAWVVPEEDPEDTWFWTSGGGVVILREDGSRKLVVFLFHMTRRNDEESSWNFRGIGWGMAIVDHAELPEEEWQVRQVAVPHTIPVVMEDGSRSVKILNWGVSALLSGTGDEPDSQELLYLYGIDDTNTANKLLMLARVVPSRLEDLSQWEYWCGPGRWSPNPEEAKPLVENLSSELSVAQSTKGDLNSFIMVYSEPMFGNGILMRRATEPEGPWSAPEAVYRVPGLDRGRDYFTYAAKGHLQLSRPGELLITYIINANNFWDAASDASIYRPRFVKLLSAFDKAGWLRD